MRIQNFISALCGLSLLLCSCTSEEVELGNTSVTSPGVHVRLTGAAAATTIASRATIEAQDGEKTVNNLLAVLFDTHEGFYKTVPATRVGNTDEYTFIVEKDATYDIWLVANASDELKSALEAITPGTKMEDENGVNCLESITTDQPCDEDGNFLMVSKYSEKLTTRITETQSIGEVHMVRLAARFDLLNKAENVTVTSVAFANRTIKSALLTPNTMSTSTDWYENKDYELDVAGEPENGTPWEGHIYTYENHAASGDFMAPVLTISYYEGDNREEIKTHEVKLIDTNSTTGATMPIKRNNLYRIILTKATKLDFDIQVADWDDAEPAIEHPELPLNLPKGVQDSLNRQLLVYDHFTKYYVKSIDYANKTVEFFDNYTFDSGELTNSFFNITELVKFGLTLEGATLTKDGTKYRMATLGDAQLIAPILPENNINQSLSYYEQIYDNEFSEYVYLKNLSNNQIDSDHDILTENTYGFTGLSQIKKGRTNSKLTYNSDGLHTDITADVKNQYNIAPIYGIRFKGTKQYSAYKWESTYVNNDINNRAVSIKIKALPDDSNITINDIVDNHSFWRNDDCIEIIFPEYGYYQNGIHGKTSEAALLISTIKINQTFHRLLVNARKTFWGTTTGSTSHPLLLVKVKQQSEENE